MEGVYTYPHCPFREVTHAAARRIPALRRIAAVLWPAARRAEWLRVSESAIESCGLGGRSQLRWDEIESVHLRGKRRRARLVIQAEDGRRIVVAGTMPAFPELADRIGATASTWYPVALPHGRALRLR